MAADAGVILGVDLGGTKMLVGAVDEEGRVLSIERDLTHPEEGADAVIARLARLCSAAREKAPGRPVRAVSIGVPGGVDTATGIVDRAPNLGWTDVPLGERLEKLVGARVILDNDVRVAVLGEHAGGAGKGTQTMVGVWVGTGIGGGVIINGRLHQGNRGVAGEIGHSVVVDKGPRCPCGRRGCIEALASRTSIEREVRAAIADGVKSSVLERMAKKGRTQLSSGIIQKALADGDPALTKVFKKAQRYLGIFTTNLINTLDPEVVVFGGGIAERMGEDFVAPIRAYAHEHLLSRRDLDRVRIVTTELKEAAPIVGAAALGRERLAHGGGHSPSPTVTVTMEVESEVASHSAPRGPAAPPAAR